MQNYIVGDFGKVYLVDGAVLDVVGVREVDIVLPTGMRGLYRKSHIFPS